MSGDPCDCELRHRQWDPITGRCRQCGGMGRALGAERPPAVATLPIAPAAVPPIVHVATAVICGRGTMHGQCLYALRPAGVLRPGVWEHPGGKLELGENATAAAIRECREELGVELVVDGTLTTVSLDLVTSVIVLTAVAGHIGSGKPRPLAADRLLWAHPQRAVDRMPCTPGTYLIHRAVTAWLARPT